MSSPEPIVFVPDPDGQEHIWDGKENGPFIPVRRLPPGWLAEAVNRAVRVLKDRGFHLLGADLHALHEALFPSPEPEEWEREAARTWYAGGTPGEAIKDALARHFAKARRERGKP